MRKRIIKLLKKGFSPEQIIGRSRLEGIAMVDVYKRQRIDNPVE